MSGARIAWKAPPDADEEAAARLLRDYYQTGDESAFAPNVDVKRFYEEIVALNPALESLNDEQLDSTSTWAATAPGPICSLSSTPLWRRHGHGHAE